MFAAADWTTEKIELPFWPVTVIVPILTLLPPFAATEYETAPLPRNSPVVVTLIHGVLLDTDQPQVEGEDTLKEPLPEEDVIDCCPDESW